MRFEVYKDNGGRFHWRLVEEDGAVVAVSAVAFGSSKTARASADDTLARVGLLEPGR